MNNNPSQCVPTNTGQAGQVGQVCDKVWDHMHIGSITQAEISNSIFNREWQETRRSMKGKRTTEKGVILYKYLCMYMVAKPRCLAQIVVTNYINALLRGGQLKRDDNGCIVVNRE